jgi:hypothetical protein
MSLKFIFESDAAQLRKDPLASGEDIYEGEFVTRNSDGKLARYDPSTSDLPDGIVVHHVGKLSDALNLHDEDYSTYEELYHFEAADGDSVYYLPLEQGQTIMPVTIEDDALDEPDISDGTTVAVTADGTSGKTRVVDAGNSSISNSTTIGTVYQQKAGRQIFADNYGERIPVMLSANEFQ